MLINFFIMVKFLHVISNGWAIKRGYGPQPISPFMVKFGMLMEKDAMILALLRYNYGFMSLITVRKIIL